MAANSIQETMDLALVAHLATLKYKVPFLSFFDGFRTSHEVAKIEELTDEDIRTMITADMVSGHRGRAMTPDRPELRGTAQNPDAFFQAREAVSPFYEACPAAVARTMDRFAALTGRQYKFAEEYKLDDADMVMVMLGSSAGTAKDVIDEYREKGVKVGLLKLRMFRPFPAEQLVPVLAGRKAIAVLDRSASFGGWGGPVFTEIRSALYGQPNPAPLANWIYGLGGRDFELHHAAEVIDAMQTMASGGEVPTLNLLGCRA